MPGVNVNIRHSDEKYEFVGKYYGDIDLRRGNGMLHYKVFTSFEGPFSRDPTKLPDISASLVNYEVIERSVELSLRVVQEAIWHREELFKTHGIDISAREVKNYDRNTVRYIWKEIAIGVEDYEYFFDRPEFEPDDSVRDSTEIERDYNYL